MSDQSAMKYQTCLIQVSSHPVSWRSQLPGDGRPVTQLIGHTHRVISNRISDRIGRHMHLPILSPITPKSPSGYGPYLVESGISEVRTHIRQGMDIPRAPADPIENVLKVSIKNCVCKNKTCQHQTIGVCLKQTSGTLSSSFYPALVLCMVMVKIKAQSCI